MRLAPWRRRWHFSARSEYGAPDECKGTLSIRQGALTDDLFAPVRRLPQNAGYGPHVDAGIADTVRPDYHRDPVGTSGESTSWIAVIGDRIDGLEPQDTIATALAHAATAQGASLPELRWLGTDRIERDGVALLQGAAGAWCAPGSPYRSLTGALDALAFARRQRLPLLGTCAGFQHGVIEFARNALGHAAAAHAEYGTDGEDELFIDELLCSLVGQVMDVDIVDDQLAAMYGARRATERYYCRFGLNPKWRLPLHRAGLVVAGTDATDGDVRILRLTDHPYYVLTLFVPQTSSTPAVPHPLVAGFLAAVNTYAGDP